MTPETRRQAFEIFDEVCDLPETERSERLRERCGDDTDLLTAVKQMLHADTTNHDSIAPGAGAELLAVELTNEEAPMPERIGGYRVVRELGRGGMGVVYEADQDEPRRRVAVKVIRDVAAGREVSRRFRLESQLLGRLQHPGIAQVYEAGTDTQLGIRRAFYAMEYVEGLPIDRHANEYALGIDQRIELIARVCDAVHHAHQKGVLHRDIKPANVLVVADDDGTTATDTRSGSIDTIGQPKIVDFGVARLTDDSTEHTTQRTHAGQIIGSLPCMSPEQLSGRRDEVDTRTDVYAIGVLLYRLLSGRSPHDLTGLSIPEAARIVAEREPTPLAEGNPSLRGDLSVIVAKAMEREPDRRYDSAAALSDDLRRCVRGEPILARPTSGWYRFGKFAKRHKASFAAGISVAGLLVAASVISLSLAWSESEARRKADHATYRASISAAAAALRDGDSRLAREFLLEAPEELRGWEWAYFWNQLDQSLAHGQRTYSLTGEQADFMHMGAWLNDDETILHTATTYIRNHSLHFESFEADTMRSLGTWDLPTNEQCIGIAYSPTRVVLADFESDEFVERDSRTGDELRRWTATHIVHPPLASFDPLPDDKIARTQWLSYATSQANPHASLGTVNHFGTAWVPRSGREPGIWLASTSQAVPLAVLREGSACTRFSPDGQTVILATLDRQLALHDASTGSRIWHHREAHADAPMSVAFSPDGSVVASGGQDRKIRLWDTYDGSPLGTLIGHDATVLALCFSSDGETLFSSDALTARRWRIGDVSDPDVMMTHGYFAYRVAVSPDGRFIASCVPSHRIGVPNPTEVFVRRSDESQPAQAVPVPGLVSRVVDVAFSASNRLVLLAEGHVDGSELQPLLLEYNADSLESLRTIPLGARSRPGFLESGTLHYAILQVDNALHIVSGSDEEIYTLPALDLMPEDANRTPRVSLGDDGGVEVHSYSGTALTLRGLSSHDFAGYLFDLAQSRIFVVSVDQRIRAFSLNSGREIASTGSLPTTIDALELQPDSTRLFAGCGDTAIRVWDTDTLELVAVLRGHRDSVNDLAISPDGSTLFSASDDYTVRTWTTARSARRR